MDRDPAADGPLNALLNFKGFHALQTYRAAHILYHTPGRQPLALWLQSRASQVFGADIHPAARLGEGLFLDHATGVVIGATAATGPNCSFLHGVTLGATGKDGGGERHPKLGANVLVGCGASILGNIQIGDNAKIGASSIVLRPIPAGATAVGVPAKVVGGTPPVGKPVETIAGKEAGMATAGAPLKKLEESPDVDTDLSLSDCQHSFCCVWSFLTQQGEQAVGPKAVTYPVLRGVLEPLGVEEFDLSSLFFNLDVEQNGAIPLAELQQRWDNAVKACPKFAARSEELLRSMYNKLREAGGGCSKAGSGM
uniref:serine O-acetyltransferase n=1 Tax=Rhizochromulina marina TaxID=1034831 RepID=A0A7S2SRF1_9STRA|mmetsp:Transcript_4134/g.12176  ORF Transcript_4134/g.12176 Transcript_4134/m.12176 type:complete len:310 (+) Transcript_4134:488-1417(+)